MNQSYIGILMAETPNEIAITFKITGCPIGCPGCQAEEFWDKNSGDELTDEIYEKELSRNFGQATAVLFMGGEWHEDELIKRLKQAQQLQYKTILYTGLTEDELIGKEFIEYLDYIKYGPYDAKLGPITELSTNQVYINLATGENLTHYFQDKFKNV